MACADGSITLVDVDSHMALHQIAAHRGAIQSLTLVGLPPTLVTPSPRYGSTAAAAEASGVQGAAGTAVAQELEATAEGTAPVSTIAAAIIELAATTRTPEAAATAAAGEEAVAKAGTQVAEAGAGVADAVAEPSSCVLLTSGEDGSVKVRG